MLERALASSLKENARQAILRRLGASNASELRNEIVGIFNLFDTDGSGEIGLAELLAAFRRLGVELTLKEAEKLVAEADEDGNGVVDADEFVEMVERMITEGGGLVDLHNAEDERRGSTNVGFIPIGPQGGAGARSTSQSFSLTRPRSAASTASDDGRLQERQRSARARRDKKAQEAEEEDYDKQIRGSDVPVCCGLFTVGDHHFKPNAQPLGWIRTQMARVLYYPRTIDESGNMVPPDLVTMARLRNIRLSFGENITGGANDSSGREALSWCAYSQHKGAILLSTPSSDPVGRQIELEETEQGLTRDEQVVFPNGALLPGGKSVSPNLEREDLRRFLENYARVHVKITGVGSVHWVKGQLEAMPVRAPAVSTVSTGPGLLAHKTLEGVAFLLTKRLRAAGATVEQRLRQLLPCGSSLRSLSSLTLDLFIPETDLEGTGRYECLLNGARRQSRLPFTP